METTTDTPAPLITGDYFAKIVRETVTVATRTGKKAHAAVHGDNYTHCGASTAKMLEMAEGWDGVTCLTCRKRAESYKASAMAAR